MMTLPITIDCNYLRPELAAAYLIADSNRALFVENNTAHSVPRLLEALKNQGLTRDQVEYLVITHVHLDHAGGTSKLLQACPNATVLAHPRAAPHLIDPAKLIASAKNVYGDSKFQELYGDILPVPTSRVRVIQDQEILRFGSRELKFFYTRGHANHHFCIWDSGSNGVFTGDSFGLAYPALQKNGLFIFPSTSPTDFDPAEARVSIQKILDTGASQAFLTHFGILQDLKGASLQLLRHLDFSEMLLESAVMSSEPDDGLDQYCLARLQPYFLELLKENHLEASLELLQLDLELNAGGIAHVARKRRQKKS